MKARDMRAAGVFDYGHGICAVDSVYDRREQTAIHLLMDPGRLLAATAATAAIYGEQEARRRRAKTSAEGRC